MLDASGAEHLSKRVEVAIGNASGMSTEFLGESRIALKEVAAHGRNMLDASQFSDLIGVIEQLDKAFSK